MVDLERSLEEVRLSKENDQDDFLELEKKDFVDKERIDGRLLLS